MLLENFVLLPVRTNQVMRAKHKGFNIIAFFRFFVGHKHAVKNIQQIFLPPVIRRFVCLNYCRYKNLPGEAHSSTKPKQAGTYKMSKSDSGQCSNIRNDLQTLAAEEKIQQTGKGSC